MDEVSRTILGLDLGIKTGSLVLLRVCPVYNVIEKYGVLYSWNKGPSVKDPLNNIMAFFNSQVAHWVRPEFARYLAVDWNPKEVYWSANKHNSNVKTLINGYITGIAHTRNVDVRYVSPKAVRDFFGYNQKTPKEEVQRKFVNIPYMYSGQLIQYEAEHDLDAAIVAYVLSHKLRGINRYVA